jgi:hypothetical protein
VAYKPKWESTRAGQYVDAPDPLGATSTKIKAILLEVGQEQDRQNKFNVEVGKAVALIHERWKKIDKAQVVEKIRDHGWQIKGLYWVVTGLIIAVFELYRRK